MPAAQLQPDFVNGVSAAKKSLRFTAEFPKPYVAQHIFNFLQNIKLFHVFSFIYGFSFDLNCLFGVVHMFFRCIFHMFDAFPYVIELDDGKILTGKLYISWWKPWFPVKIFP